MFELLVKSVCLLVSKFVVKLTFESRKDKFAKFVVDWMSSDESTAAPPVELMFKVWPLRLAAFNVVLFPLRSMNSKFASVADERSTAEDIVRVSLPLPPSAEPA